MTKYRKTGGPPHYEISSYQYGYPHAKDKLGSRPVSRPRKANLYMRRDPDLQTCVIHWLFNTRRELSIYFVGTNRPFRQIETLLETINAQIVFGISVSVHGSTQWWTYESCNLLCFVEVGYCWVLTQIIGVLHWFVVMINQPFLPVFFTFLSPVLDYPIITPLPIKKHWLKW